MLPESAVIQTISTSIDPRQGFLARTCDNLDPFRRLVHQGAKPEWRGVNDVYWLGRFDCHTRGNQLDWNCFRVGGDLWASALAAKGRLDGVVPGHDGSHQRDGILLPISQAAALAHPRRHFAGASGIRDRRPLQISTRGCLATSLPRHCGAFSLAECVCVDRPALHESAGAPSARANWL